MALSLGCNYTSEGPHCHLVKSCQYFAWSSLLSNICPSDDNRHPKMYISTRFGCSYITYTIGLIFNSSYALCASNWLIGLILCWIPKRCHFHIFSVIVFVFLHLHIFDIFMSYCRLHCFILPYLPDLTSPLSTTGIYHCLVHLLINFPSIVKLIGDMQKFTGET